MTRRQKRAEILSGYADDVRSVYISDDDRLKRLYAALDALAAIDAGRRWAQVLREFER